MEMNLSKNELRNEVSNYRLELVFIDTGCPYSYNQAIETEKFQDENPNILVRTEYPDENNKTPTIISTGYRVNEKCITILLLRDGVNGDIINSSYFVQNQNCLYIKKWFDELLAESVVFK